jgi:hypothetical protein
MNLVILIAPCCVAWTLAYVSELFVPVVDDFKFKRKDR